MEEDIPEDFDFVCAELEKRKEQVRELNAAIKRDKQYLTDAMGKREEMKSEKYVVKKNEYTVSRCMSLKDIREEMGDGIADALTKRTVSTRFNITPVITPIPPGEEFRIEDDDDTSPAWAKSAYHSMSSEEE